MKTFKRPRRTATKETGRLEAFSDGVFAIAITLLMLDIRVPAAGDLPRRGGLAAALLHQWPIYLAFVTSFLTILVMWINHHRLFRHIARINQPFLILNGLLLMGVTLVPFPTSLLAEYIRHPNARVAAAVYSGTYVYIAVLFNLLWRYAAEQNRLLYPQADPQAVRAITEQYRFGPLLYGICFAAAFFHVGVSVALCMALAVFFVLPGAGGGAKRPNSRVLPRGAPRKP